MWSSGSAAKRAALRFWRQPPPAHRLSVADGSDRCDRAAVQSAPMAAWNQQPPPSPNPGFVPRSEAGPQTGSGLQRKARAARVSAQPVKNAKVWALDVTVAHRLGAWSRQKRPWTLQAARKGHAQSADRDGAGDWDPHSAEAWCRRDPSYCPGCLPKDLSSYPKKAPDFYWF